jgi:DNA-directed RNA polymerase subunit L
MPFKEMADICNSWGNTLENLSKIMTDGAIKTQETWKDTIEKLIEMNYELLKTFARTGEKGEKPEVLKSVKSA